MNRDGTADVIVLGLGAMGSAAAYHLARRGRQVIGLEQFTPGHDRGSSHGRSRIIREAYFEHPDYVPLVRRAYELWAALQAEDGSRLFLPTGGLMIGPHDGALVQGALASARTHDLDHEVLDSAGLRARYPVFQVRDDAAAVWEPRAGVLFPEAGVLAHLRGALRHGARLRTEERVLAWHPRDGGVEVETDRGVYGGDHLVVTAGPWAAQVLTDLGLPLQVERNVMYWFQPADPALFAPHRLPVYIYEYRREAFIYGFPRLGDDGVKVAHHHSGEICTPEDIRRDVSADEVSRMREILAHTLPGLAGELRQAVTCMYTNTPDGHFIIDRHPRHPQVILACGFSGHGFKFAPVVGEILADLAVDGRTRHRIDLFRLDRFMV
ncbi:MAG: N-methyl-L-tryptophan oxidase [Armatimonadota bacterium]|nr:N-methyl-L-tryptophan oxidase [Armatimonadota bacterium]MDR7451820.1 N-methyl-L-tryptophan oxidase [Armatimonadota bacterium]MDR7467545.1 N-methyl-L-tryptophan oxidase [Armatimonadota bacterium]MDR7494494.1 N-methyl-L-tryptophan oxidase [Armatimonadota bacterium]MDR7499755.1 N-methyl-L-tryptophan oxidase [Armatimonadota bacterium]